MAIAHDRERPRRKRSTGDTNVPAGKPRARARRPLTADNSLFVVGVGASAGGLEALRPFVAHLPKSSNMAYVVVQHLSPQYRSMMVQLLARETTLKVVEIADGTAVEPDVIYITPTNKDVRIRNRVLTLKEPSAPLGPKPSVDVFFNSLAEDCGPNAIGVILSGTGSDGAHGVRALKAADGFTIAQALDSAKYDGMPKAAIDTGCIDLTLTPEQMGPELAAIARFPRPVVRQPTEIESSDAMRTLFRLVRNRTGVDFSQYKMNTIRRRLERRLAANRIKTLPEYVDFTHRNPGELDLLCKDILISVTSFFRDARAFDEVKEVLAEAVRGKGSGDSIRIWVPGCATGEEAYSFALILDELLGDAVRDHKVQIFATDIDAQAMAHARRGIYSEAALDNLDRHYLSRYFEPVGNAYQVRKQIRDMVVFARQDLAKDPPFVKVDLISCRNVLIYFNGELQDRVFRLFHYALNPEGYLFLGKSESVGRNSDLFRPVRPAAKIFQRRPSSSAADGSVFRSYRPVLPELAARPAAQTAPSIDEVVKQGFVDACMPPSVAVNADLDVVYIHGNVARFVKIPEGAPTNNLARMVIEDFRADLRALAHRASEKGVACFGARKRLRGTAGETAVRIVVRPIGRDILLVSWEEAELPEQSAAVEAPNSPEAEDRMAELEQELAATKEHLQTVIEELETSNEELQALNEELQAANEELQSSNEELETANEELQATNEELTTLNQELQVRTAELGSLNADLVNIQDNIGFPLVVVDKELRLSRYTPPAIRLFGILATDVGQDITSLPNRILVKALRDRLKKVVSSGVAFEDEVESDGRYYRMRIAPYRNRHNEVDGATLTFVDETEVRKAGRRLEELVAHLRKSEEELLAAKDAAEAANRAKSSFLARMSHELRTPLNAILGFSEMMEQEMFGPLGNDRYREYSRLVLESGRHLLNLIDDVLDLARIEAGKLPVTDAEVDLARLTQWVVTLLGDRARRGGVTVTTVLPPNLPRLIADEMAVRRVLFNIVGNAVKFTPTGGSVAITAELGADGLSVVVTDTGVGMDPAEMARISQPFEQGDRTVTHRHEGVGLGLPIAISLMAIHGGSIDFDSRPGKGTAVTIRFPRERLLEAQPQAAQAE